MGPCARGQQYVESDDCNHTCAAMQYINGAPRTNANALGSILNENRAIPQSH